MKDYNIIIINEQGDYFMLYRATTNPRNHMALCSDIIGSIHSQKTVSRSNGEYANLAPKDPLRGCVSPYKVRYNKQTKEWSIWRHNIEGKLVQFIIPNLITEGWFLPTRI